MPAVRQVWIGSERFSHEGPGIVTALHVIVDVNVNVDVHVHGDEPRASSDAHRQRPEAVYCWVNICWVTLAAIPGAREHLELPAQLLRHETARELEREISAGGIPRARSRPLNRFLWRSRELDRDAQARGEASRDGFYDAGRRCIGSFHDAFAPAPGREQLLGKKGMYGKAEDENEGIWRAREGEVSTCFDAANHLFRASCRGF